MSLFNQSNIWPIARLNNYKFGILCVSIITMFSIIGFIYINGDALNEGSKVVVAVSQNENGQNIDNIIQILEKHKGNYGYQVIPEDSISKILFELDNTASKIKYLSNKDNYVFPIFIEFNYKVYYQFNIDVILKDIIFTKYIIDNSLSFINIFFYIFYIAFLILALALCNMLSLKLDKKYIQFMNYSGANKNLLISILFKRIVINSLLGFIIGWLIIFIILNILNLTNVISSNTIDFINLKNMNSIFYFLLLFIIILYSQYITVLMILKKYMENNVK
ncbi:hypothetical protein N9423_00800 [Alphaproteobacteria bacterium]|nr:hypothetical protein [Alphaproteobacteria bacterium]